MERNYFHFCIAAAVFLVLFTPVISNQVVNALGTTSTLTVNAQDLNGVAISGVYIQLSTNGKQIASGYSPAAFVVNNTQMYTVTPNNYLTYIFDHWLDTGSTTSTRNISISSDTTITAVYKTASSAVSTTPRPPTGLTATATSSSQINLSWTAPTDNGGSAITGYKIERSTDSGTTWSTIVANSASTSTTYSDTGLAASTAYTYRVSAINAIGTGSPSNTASATTSNAVPQPPTGLTATAASSSQINLSWAAPANNGGSAITGYKIERVTGAGSFVTIVGNTNSTTTTYSDTGLAASTAYTYRVSAINSVGTSSPSNTASATTSNAVPQPPTGLTATAISSSQINLSWTAPANNGGSAITGYKIERSTNAGSTWTILANIGNTTTYSDTGLAASTAYTYRVSAINAIGTGSPSNTASATTQSATAPQPPTGLTATAASPSQINLSWTAPSSNGGSAITGYKIERSTDSGTTWSTIVANSASTSTAYSDTGLAASTAYTYRVSAINSVGTSSPSNTASATTSSVAATYKLTVTTQLKTGESLSGLYVELDQNGTKVSSGYSPAAFTLKNGAQYSVVVGNYGTYVFESWLDSGSPSNPRLVSISSDTTITAVYRDTAIALAPSRGSVGNAVSVTGTTFSPSHTITLTWDGSTLATNPSVITSNLTGGFTATFQVPASTVGSHKVTATDATNTHSALFTYDPPPTAPQPPTGLTATAASPSQINLSWTAPSSNGGSAITGYKIERSTDSGTTWSTIVANSASTSTTYSDTGLAASTAYTYRVSAINSVGTSSPSNTASATTALQPPQPPTGLTATATSSSQINLSWTAPSSNGGSAITGYKIERSTNAGSTWSTIVANSASTSTAYSDTGLAASTAYTYRVSAINSVGTSSPSNTASATTTAPSTGITVYAHRIPAPYWDPCFAYTCSAGTGPGAKMYFGLYDSSGKLVQSGYSDENGYTFAGLNVTATYYVYPADCDMCHVSFHDVVFQYWGDNHSNVRPRAAMVGASLDAWYSCTNGCALGP